MKNFNLHIQEDQVTPCKINSKRSTYRHIIIKMSEGKDNERILKAVIYTTHLQKDKHLISYQKPWSPESSEITFTRY